MTGDHVETVAPERLRAIAEAADANGWPIPEWVTAVTPDDIIDLLDVLDEATTDLAELTRERDSVGQLASAMALAIGWETPGDTWVEKAANWRQDPDSLPALYSELLELRCKVQAYEEECECGACPGHPDPETAP